MKTRTFIYCLSLFVLFVFISISCKKSDDTPSEGNKIELGSSEVDSISYTIIKVSTDLVSTGGNQITKYGHCWGINSEPTLDDDYSNLGNTSNPGSFTSEIEGLLDNTLYHIRPYAQFSNGTVYGSQIDASTWKTGKPNVVTANISDLGLNSAICGGTVVSDSGMTVTTYGVCWDTQSNPDLNNFLGKTEDGSGIGEFSSSISDLSEYTLYFVRAYAINENGVSYGEIISFYTHELSFPIVITSPVTTISTNSATSGGEVTDDGSGTVNARGVCWSTQANPSLENCIGYTVDGNGLGNFPSIASDLTENTQYYITAYATNEKGTAYGEIRTFTTLVLTLPVVTTESITDISYTTATGGGDVISNGNGSVSAKGVCWSTIPNPTLENAEDYTVDGTGLGYFISDISNLSSNTTYYLAAYATNEKGEAYGDVIFFTTLEITLPLVETSPITNITYNSSKCGGWVNSSGSGDIISRGVCWGINPNPTIDNCIGHTIDGSGLGEFFSDITGLEEGTQYYVRGYGTNSLNATGYGQDKIFTTHESCGVFFYGGKQYETIVIGDQCWMRTNLNIGTRIDGGQNHTNNQVIEKYCYDNNEENCDIYGGLYQWDEMMQYTTLQGTQGICPDGWHLPSDEEWKVLEGSVDSQYGIGNIEWDDTGYRGLDVGKKLKTTNYWSYGVGTDEFLFSVLPGGERYSNNVFVGLSEWARFWSSTEGYNNTAIQRSLLYESDKVYRGTEFKDPGFSVRCIKNE